MNRMINSVPDDAVHFVLGALVTHIEERGYADTRDLAQAVEHWHRYAAGDEPSAGGSVEEEPAHGAEDCSGDGCDLVHL